MEIVKPEAKSELYYADLRAYKQRNDHEVFFGWFGGWNTKSANMRGFLRSVPDSVDIISIWNGTYDREDLEYVQKVKGTRVTFTIFAHKIPKAFMGGENKPMEGKYDYHIKQNNGKENVFKHIFQGYILPKDKQIMIP